MGRGCWLIHLLLMCSLDTTLMLVNTLSVAIFRVTPSIGDPVVEGSVVQLLCEATGLMAGYIIEWTRLVIVEAQEVSIARNGISLDSRYTLGALVTVSGGQYQYDTLTFNATKEDTGVSYGCRVRDSVELSSTVLVVSQTIYLTVLYFPSAMYPICLPDGPVTVQEGTTVNMSCTTEIGNPAVLMQIITSSVVYGWGYDRDSKEQIISFHLSVTAADDGGSYVCKINPHSNSTTFKGMERSCTMGPITVGPMTTPQHPITSVEPTSKDSHRTMTKESNVVCTPWLVAFIIILILFIVSLIINIFLLIKHRHLKITKEKETNVAKADPYMELQPTEDKNKVYMEPTTATTTTQDTYYQPVEVETDSPEYDYARQDDPKEQRMNHQVSVHVNPTPSLGTTDIQHTYYQSGKIETDSQEGDYARPEGSTNTDYEAVRQPQSSAERPYQNINNNNNNNNNNDKKRRLGVVVSPEFIYARPEGSTTISEEARKPQSSAERPYYQNINNNNNNNNNSNNNNSTNNDKKRRVGVVVSPEFVYTRPEGSTTTSEEARKPKSSAERLNQNVTNNQRKRRLGVVFNPIHSA